MSAPIIEFDATTVRYQHGPVWNRQVTTAVSDVSLAIGSGETLGLVGESGSGKTTLGHVAVGLLQPSTGAFRFEGGHLDRRRRRQGVVQAVFQQPDWSLNPRLRIATSVAEPLRVTGVRSRSERLARTQEMLERVGLDPSMASRYPHELSGGQRQRVAVARALITDPRFVLFDEVVTALDVSVQAQLLNLIRDLQAERGFAALFISHDLAVVRYVADRIAVLYRSELLEVAPAARFYGEPDHEYSKALCAAITTAPDAGVTS